MTNPQQPAPTRQPSTIWDATYQAFSKAQHAKAATIGERIVSEPVTLKELGGQLAADIKKMVVDADAAANARYKELAAERDALEAEVARLTGLAATAQQTLTRQEERLQTVERKAGLRK